MVFTSARIFIVFWGLLLGSLFPVFWNGYSKLQLDLFGVILGGKQGVSLRDMLPVCVKELKLLNFKNK